MPEEIVREIITRLYADLIRQIMEEGDWDEEDAIDDIMDHWDEEDAIDDIMDHWDVVMEIETRPGGPVYSYLRVDNGPVEYFIAVSHSLHMVIRSPDPPQRHRQSLTLSEFGLWTAIWGS